MMQRLKIIPRKSEVDNRDAFDNMLRKNVSYYTAVRFLGRGKFLRFEGKTIQDVKEQASKAGTDSNKRPYGIYAVCPLAGVDHTVHVENFIVR